MGKSKLIIVSLLALLLAGLPSGSFNLVDYLTNQIATDKHNKAQLDYALQQNNETALRYAWQQAKKYSLTWQRLAKQLAKTQGQAAYELAIYYQTQNIPLQAKAWYQRAIRLEFPPAFVALAQHYFQQNKLLQSEELLTRLPNTHSETTAVAAYVLKINLAINRGDIHFVEDKIAEFDLLKQNTKQGRLLLDNINKYQVLTSNNNNDLTPTCANSLQLFATNFAHLQYLETLIEGFNKQRLSQFICFSPVRYLPIKTLDCAEGSAQAIQCDEQ
ncbi:MAG: hypothetical protein OQK22_11070, partial [Colwellia sp.]|nr:hypothetical protein [Colwellia sp.]